MAYHEGELAVQRAAGVENLASRVARIIGPEIPPIAAEFLAAQPFVIVATDDGEHVWASLVPGHARTLDRTTILVDDGTSIAAFTEPSAAGAVGLLAIEFATKRRMRVNGRGHREGDALVIETSEVYSNCPQYITPRRVTFPHTEIVAQRAQLSVEDVELIRKADTFFIASTHPRSGADASHRGGAPGFVTVESDTRLSWPDYSGNNMFNTLGNLTVDPRCGLLFVDFTTGATLQLTGKATVAEDRRVTVEIAKAVVSAPRAKTP
ncbi:MAG TPA: pyridoxamine 5'-phosphate oxidase family protein [Thermoanaerobaculia bacterium]